VVCGLRSGSAFRSVLANLMRLALRVSNLQLLPVENKKIGAVTFLSAHFPAA